MTDLLTGPPVGTRDTTTDGSAAARPLLADPAVCRAVDLVSREAALLDAKDYEPWLALYTADARYVIPIDQDTDDFDSRLNMIYDDARMRRMRVNRIQEGFSISSVDAARTIRSVGRFVAHGVADGVVRLRAAQIIVSYKRGTQAVLAGELEHHIVLGDQADGTGDRIRLKVIRLINSEAAVNASGYLL